MLVNRRASKLRPPTARIGRQSPRTRVLRGRRAARWVSCEEISVTFRFCRTPWTRWAIRGKSPPRAATAMLAAPAVAAPASTKCRDKCSAGEPLASCWGMTVLGATGRPARRRERTPCHPRCGEDGDPAAAGQRTSRCPRRLGSRVARIGRRIASHACASLPPPRRMGRIAKTFGNVPACALNAIYAERAVASAARSALLFPAGRGQADAEPDHDQAARPADEVHPPRGPREPLPRRTRD